MHCNQRISVVSGACPCQTSETIQGDLGLGLSEIAIPIGRDHVSTFRSI